jgi:hypothetical protein
VRSSSRFIGQSRSLRRRPARAHACSRNRAKPPCFSIAFISATQQFEQARDHDQDRRPHLLDVRSKLFQALGIEDLRAKADRQELPAAMFERMAERQEGQEDSRRQPKSSAMISAAPSTLCRTAP